MNELRCCQPRAVTERERVQHANGLRYLIRRHRRSRCGHPFPARPVNRSWSGIAAREVVPLASADCCDAQLRVDLVNQSTPEAAPFRFTSSALANSLCKPVNPPTKGCGAQTSVE